MYNEETLPADDVLGAVTLPKPSGIGRRNHALAGQQAGLRINPTGDGDPSVFTNGLIIGL